VADAEHMAQLTYSLPAAWRTACEVHAAGLWYVPDYASEAAASRLAAAVYESGDWCELSSRRLQMFGGAPHPDGAVCEPLPEHIQSAAAGAADALGGDADFCLVNSYAHGGISPHSDGPRFHDAVAVLSLEGPALIRFGLVDKAASPELPGRVELLLRPRSLLVFSGAFYALYVHVIASRAADPITELCRNRADARGRGGTAAPAGLVAVAAGGVRLTARA